MHARTTSTHPGWRSSSSSQKLHSSSSSQKLYSSSLSQRIASFTAMVNNLSSLHCNSEPGHRHCLLDVMDSVSFFSHVNNTRCLTGLGIPEFDTCLVFQSIPINALLKMGCSMGRYALLVIRSNLWFFTNQESIVPQGCFWVPYCTFSSETICPQWGLYKQTIQPLLYVKADWLFYNHILGTLIADNSRRQGTSMTTVFFCIRD